MAFIGTLAVPAGTTIEPRKGLRRAAVAIPLLTVACAAGLRAAVARLVGFQHPLGWPLNEELTVRFMRSLLEHGDIGVWRAFFRIATRLGKVPPGLEVRPVEREGSRSCWYELEPGLQPAQPEGTLNILFIHGGAFMAGICQQYQIPYAWWLRKLARRGIRARVLSIEYPLAPEHPYPSARDFCKEEINWFLQQSGDTPAVVGGDSAGGNLAISALSHMRDTGRLPRPPAGMLLISPAVDSTPSSIFNVPDPGGAGRYDYLPRKKLHEGLPAYYTTDLMSPYVSPILLESFEGLVKGEIMLVSGGEELMAPDIRAFAKKLQGASDASVLLKGEAGFKALIQEEPGCVHSWPMLMFPRLLPRQEPMLQFFGRAAAAPAAARQQRDQT